MNTISQLFNNPKNIIIAVSGVFYLITTIIKKSLGYNKIKKARVITIKELLKNPDKYINTNLFITGRINTNRYYLNPLYDFFLLDPESENNNTGITIDPIHPLVINSRTEAVQYNLLVISLAVVLALADGTISLINFTRQYFDKKDNLILYGKVIKSDNNLYLNTHIICRGNKLDCINDFKDQTLLLNLFQKASGLMFFYGILINLYTKYVIKQSPVVINETQPNTQCRENCQKCKRNYANVIMKECNHFNICSICFELNKCYCLLCKKICKEYTILS